MILNALDGQPLPVYGDGLYVRDWIHVEDHCEAIDRGPASAGTSGEVYNIGAENERPNLDVVRAILRLSGRGRIADSSRPRSARARSPLRDELTQDPRRARLAPAPRVRAGLAETVAWYRANARGRSACAAAPTATTTNSQYAGRLSGE